MRRWLTRGRGGLLLAGAGLLAGTGWLLANGGRGVNIAVVLTFTVAGLGVLLQFPSLRRDATLSVGHEELSGIARDLARRSSARESEQLQKLLAVSGRPQPAETEFARTELVFWREDGGDAHGTLADIAAYYSGLDLRRLVILGAAGVGKTVLASQLLIDLVRSGDSLPDDMRAVPIRLSLPAFDPGSNPLRAEPRQLAARLDHWITSQLTMSPFNLSRNAAAALIRDGRILPVLDGLDETDPADQLPTRAIAIVRALNHPVGPALRPVVLTCRTGTYYKQLASLRAPAGYDTTLQDATVVMMLPLTEAKLRAYITRRFPDPAIPGQIQPRWQPVTGHLAGPLGKTLSSPLYLFLAVTAYHDQDWTAPAFVEAVTSGKVGAHGIEEAISR